MRKINLTVAGLFLLVHTAAIWLGTRYFTWQAFWACIALTFFFNAGITVVYHRYLTHGGFETYWPLRWLLTIWGLLAGEGPPIIWVANHRKHHQFSDREGDPHSPLHGIGHSHIWWMTYFMSKGDQSELFRRYAKDLMDERFMRVLFRTYIFWQIGFAVLTLWVGRLIGGPEMGWSFLAWAFFVRMCLVWHITWCVNSWTHLKFLGYRNYETTDQSQNNPVVALLACGEGWHNNHHKFPTCTWHGHKWWEFDVSGLFIWMLKTLKIIWNVKDNLPEKT